MSEPATAQAIAAPITVALPVSILESLPVLKRAHITRTTVPILSNLYIASDGRSLQLRATNLEVTAQYSVILDESIEAFATTVPLVPFIDAVKNGKSLRMAVYESRVVLDVDGAKRELLTMPAEEFPPMPTFEPHASSQMAFAQLVAAIVRTSKVASDENARGAVLMGVQLACKNGDLFAVATDGSRLSYVAIGTSGLGDFETILPAALTRALGAVKFSKKAPAIDARVDVNHVKTIARIEAGPWTFVARTVDGQYPNWRSVLPKYSDLAARIVLERKAFIALLKNGVRAASGRAKLVAFDTVKTASAGDTLRVSAKNDDEGSFAGSVPARTHSPLVATTHFNGAFLAELLETLTAETILVVFDGYSAATVFDGEDDSSGSWSLIIPMRVK